MSFRKRNAVISAPPAAQASTQSRTETQLAPGLRPSPLDGRLTTSTGTSSLDAILAGHAGLTLGSSLLIEEHGTTDFSGALLRYYAAEGLVQGHHVHVFGFSEGWKYELPSLSAKKDSTISRKMSSQTDEKLKIAWRYENLANRNAPSVPAKDREGGSNSVFCHTFDLTKRLASASIKGTMTATPASGPMSLSFASVEKVSPFKLFIKSLQTKLRASSPTSIHRVVVPSLLSPTLYTPGSCRPTEVLQFMHSLRALLRRYSGQLTVLITLPVSLFSRSSGMTRWVELLSDGVLEMIPLPPKPDAAPSPVKSSSKEQDQSQGLIRVHSLPVFHEKGGGGAEGNYFREDLSFHLSSSKGLVIQPYVLPPMEDEDHKEMSPASTVKDGIGF